MWNKEDSIFLIVFFTTATITAVLQQSGAIGSEVGLILFFVILIATAAPTVIKSHLQKIGWRIFNRDLTDYWFEATTKLRESNKNYAMHYNLSIPDKYIPTEQLELPEIKLSLHTIKTEETSQYGTEYQDILYPEKTIIYNYFQQKVVGIMPLNMNETLDFLKKYKGYFTKESTSVFIPQTLRELSFGTPVKPT